MKLELHLRVQFHSKLRKHIIKNSCECCGTTEKLHLHHEEIHFATMLNETLSTLKLEYKDDINKYHESELILIGEVMLGKQSKIKYKTLCEECHIEYHKVFKKDFSNYHLKKRQKEEVKRKEICEYIDSLVGAKLFANEQKSLCKLLKSSVIGIDYRSDKVQTNKLKFIIEDLLGLPLIVSGSKKESKGEHRGKRYIIISKIHNEYKNVI